MTTVLDMDAQISLRLLEWLRSETKDQREAVKRLEPYGLTLNNERVWFTPQNQRVFRVSGKNWCVTITFDDHGTFLAHEIDHLENWKRDMSLIRVFGIGDIFPDDTAL